MRAAILLIALPALAGCSGEEVLFVRSADADMPVWLRGNADTGKTILVVHGGPGGSSQIFADSESCQALEGDAVMAYWDQRAAGSSQGNAGAASLTLAQYVADLEAVVKVLRHHAPAQRLYLWGHSWGGLLTAAYLVDPQRQQAISGWINLDGPSSFPENQSASRNWALLQARQRVERGEEPARWQAVVSFYEEHPVLTADLALRHYENVVALGGAVHREEVLQQGTSSQLIYLSPFGGLATLSNQDYTLGVITGQDGPDAIFNAHVTPELPGITVPALLIWGRHDGQVPLEIGDRILATLGTPAASKQLVVLESSAHNGQVEEPEAFAGAVRAFLARP